MKRSPLFLAAAVVAIALLAVIAHGQQPGAGGGRIMPGAGIQPAGPPEPGEMATPPMGRARMGQPAIAVSGNYIYVLSGGLLLKYDDDLNLIKQVELPRAERPGGWVRGGGMGRRGGGGGRGMGGPRAW